MAICPKCKATIGMTAIKCESCGYDFPQTIVDNPASGWEHSNFADFSLIIGAICSVIVCIMIIVNSAGSLLRGKIMDSGLGVLQAIVMFAMFVVFLRVKKG